MLHVIVRRAEENVKKLIAIIPLHMGEKNYQYVPMYADKSNHLVQEIAPILLSSRKAWTATLRMWSLRYRMLWKVT